MITAIDSSALFAIFNAEPTAEAWLHLLRQHGRAGRLVVCDVVVAEVAAFFDDPHEFQRHAESLGIQFDPITHETALAASRVFRAYRARGGSREHLVPDFLIGAHAMNQADCLASGDIRFSKPDFRRLRIITVSPG